MIVWEFFFFGSWFLFIIFITMKSMQEKYSKDDNVRGLEISLSFLVELFDTWCHQK